ncbi:MAG: DUF2911 domain-containing protein [Bacteroidia bacterium]
MKKNFLKIVSVAFLITGIGSLSYSQSIKTPAPSPTQTLTQDFALGQIKIEYSRPGVKDREIFGSVVPYNHPWRTGANGSTTITFTDTVKVSGTQVAPGTFALYTVPTQAEWEIILSKNLTLGGDVGEYKPADEVLRFKVKPSVMNDKMETFTININNIKTSSCTIDLMWDKTKVSFPVTTEIDSRIEKQIAKELAPGDKKPYYAAANYYFDNGKDLNKALEWATKAAENNPNAFWMSHLKAKIQMKMKDYPGAIKSAESSMAKAREEKNDEFVKFNEKLIAEAKKMSGK